MKAVFNGVDQQASKAATVFKSNYKEIKIKHDASLKATYEPNDACCADVDGDGEVEILMKFNNKEEGEQLYPKNGPTINGVADQGVFHAGLPEAGWYRALVGELWS